MIYWILIIASLSGGTPAIVYMGTEKECLAAAQHIQWTMNRVEVSCISGTDAYTEE
jgi:hypothetical protein